MQQVIFRTLRHEYRLSCPTPKSAKDLAFMEITPEISGLSLTDVDLQLECDEEEYSVVLPGQEVVQGSAFHLLDRLHGLIFTDLISHESGNAILHCGTWVNPRNPAGRIALFGPKGVGKTTLMLALMAQGFHIEGDEHLVFRQDYVVTRPRTLRVKSSSLALVPTLADAIRALPSIRNWDGTDIHAVAPSLTGTQWTIAPASLDHIIVLEANHGGRSTLQAITPDEALQQAASETILPGKEKAASFALLRTKFLSARCHRLRLGGLESIGELLVRDIL